MRAFSEESWTKLMFFCFASCLASHLRRRLVWSRPEAPGGSPRRINPRRYPQIINFLPGIFNDKPSILIGYPSWLRKPHAWWITCSSNVCLVLLWFFSDDVCELHFCRWNPRKPILKSPKIWVSIPASENVADKPSPVIRKAPLEQRSAAARLIQLGDAGPEQLKCSELTTKKRKMTRCHVVLGYKLLILGHCYNLT